MNIPKFKKGDLVYYDDFMEDSLARPNKQIGVVVHVFENVSPLFSHLKNGEHYVDEYIVIWIGTGFRSTLLGLNLRKVEIPDE